MSIPYSVTCRYCGERQIWEFEPSANIPTIEDVIEHDYKYSCCNCWSMVKVNEALDQTVLDMLGYGERVLKKITKYDRLLAQIDKEDHFRLITTEQLEEWEKIIDVVISDPNAHLAVPEHILNILENLMHDIVSIKL